MYACMECGRLFRNVQSAERAVRNGCPKCGGVDIDLALSDEFAARLLDRVDQQARCESANPPVVRWHKPSEYQY
jgi:predicted  nucleic acid-binding Zn-ribbon protein